MSGVDKYVITLYADDVFVYICVSSDLRKIELCCIVGMELTHAVVVNIYTFKYIQVYFSSHVVEVVQKILFEGPSSSGAEFLTGLNEERANPTCYQGRGSGGSTLDSSSQGHV